MALVPIIIILIFVGMYLMRTERTRMCRWRARDGGTRHVCAACGAEMDTPGGKMPKICMRPSKE
ncbi:hypothetical protein [Aliiroseovarius sp. YM-037]|uniref:hypothetical protein n=1 Tax=Aliiroseovarius sp. YM-037 TaxID=3341728 RepID=UPI003A7FC3CA